MQIIIIICFLKNVNLQGNIVKCVQIEGQKLDISSQFHYSDVSYHTADLLCLITGAILFINCENDFRLWILCNIALFIFLLIWLLFLHCFRQGNNVIYIYRTHFIHWCKVLFRKRIHFNCFKERKNHHNKKKKNLYKLTK